MFLFILSYKNTDPLVNLVSLVVDKESWGRPLATSFRTPGDGKDNIDSESGHESCDYY